MRWTRRCPTTNGTECVRRSRVVLTPRRWCQVLRSKLLRDDGGKKAGHRGEHEGNRKTIAQGKPGCLRWTCMLVCAPFCAHCTRDRGCSAHPAFPAPSVFEGAKDTQTSGAARRENANPQPHRCLTSESEMIDLHRAQPASREHLLQSWKSSRVCVIGPAARQLKRRPTASNPFLFIASGHPMARDAGTGPL